MSFSIKSAKFTGNPDNSGWVQVHDFAPEDEEKSKTRGRLLAVIASVALSSQKSVSVGEGREILARLQEEYFGNVSANAFDALKKAVEQISKEFSNQEVEVEIAAAAIVDDVVYTTVLGSGEVSIFRAGAYATILSSSVGRVVSASGKPKVGDILVLSTSKFFESIGQGVISAAFSKEDPEYAVESFAPLIHANTGQGGKGLAVIKIEEGEAESVEMVETETEDVEHISDEVVPDQRSKLFIDKFKKFPKRMFDRKIYIKRNEVDFEDVKKRRTAVTVGGMLLVLLTLSIGFGIRQQSLKNGRRDYDTKITEASHKIEEAKALFTLNPGRARELFSESKSLLDELSHNNPKDEAVKKLLSEYEGGTKSVLGEFDVHAEEFVDLSLIDGFEGGFLSAGVDTVKVYDKAKRRVAQVTISSKKTEVLVGPSKLNNATGLTSYANKIFVLEDEGVFEVDDARTKVLEKSWEGDALLTAYSGNMYVLEKSSSDIKRYPATSSGGFGSGSRWLAPGITPNLGDVTAWTIDGSVWTITSKGRVQKFTFGSPKDLNDFVVFPELVEPKAIYTNEELSNVYILDPGSSRVVVMDKEGNYKAQYKSDVIGGALGLAASEKENKIIILTKDKLYSLPIN